MPLRAQRVRSIVLLALALLAPQTSPAAPGGGETLGFVVSAWDWGFPRDEKGHCANGTNVSELEYYKVDKKQFRADIKNLGWEEATAKHLPADACVEPQAQPDPGFKTFAAVDVPVDGLDLDGVDSRRAGGGGCAHDDFRGLDGTPGIDNQHWRLVGCTQGFQTFNSERREGRGDSKKQGGMLIAEGEDNPILVEIAGVDDRRNDDDVQVRFFSGEQPIKLDANGEVVPYVSLSIHHDVKYASPPIRGRIVAGVLTTEPADLRLRFHREVLDGDLDWRKARLRATINAEDRLEGLLGFYWDADNLFHIYNDHRIDGHHTGRLLALARGYMCAGMYHALVRVADGLPDPSTGRCTAISSALRFQATPAFVITDPR
jgi:hypothetical protein